MLYKVIGGAASGQIVVFKIEADSFEVSFGCLCFFRHDIAGSPQEGLQLVQPRLFRAFAPGVWRSIEVVDDTLPTGVVVEKPAVPETREQRRARLSELVPDDEPAKAPSNETASVRQEIGQTQAAG